MVKLVLLITYLEKDRYKKDLRKLSEEEKSFVEGFTLFEEGLTFDVPEEVKPKFLVSFIFAIEDVLRRIEMYDDRNSVHDSYGYEPISFTRTVDNPFTVSVEAKDVMDGLDCLKSDSETEEDMDCDLERAHQEIHFGYDKAQSYIHSVTLVD